ncbi:MAG: dihydroorotase [Bacteroidales bacterium]|nr:dihydroorotase [Bacteroidales bacterium]
MLCEGGKCRPADILINDGVIVRIAPSIPASEGNAGVRIYDLEGCIVTRALADVHIHFRVPGRPDKETIATGSAAAARGGYSCVCPMPNLSPVPDTPAHLEEELKLIRKEGTIDILPYASITMERAGRKTVDVEALKADAVAFSDDGSGVQDEAVMRESMKRIAAAKCILAAHCEDNSLLKGGYIHDGKYAAEHNHKGICSKSEWGQIERDAALAGETGCSYHVCHISTKESVEIIRRAKQRGVDITCETAPHYLTLCEDDLQEDGRFKMNPPLRGAEDREALIEALADGTIDMIATDHAPHTAEEKSRGLAGSAMGIVGLETAFPVLYTKLVRSGRIPLERLLEAMCDAPRRRFHLDEKAAAAKAAQLRKGLFSRMREVPAAGIREGEMADLAVFDIGREYTVDPAAFKSKGRATPFAGWKVYGNCLLTLCRGVKVWSAPELAGRMQGAAGGGGSR